MLHVHVDLQVHLASYLASYLWPYLVSIISWDDVGREFLAAVLAVLHALA